MAPKSLPPLGIAALGFLLERPMHPYEMYQLAVQRQEERLMAVSPGSLYRAVYALEAAGHVRTIGTDRDGARPERTTFEITDAGREILSSRVRELLAVPVRDHALFPIAVSEAHALAKDDVVRSLEERLVVQKDDLAALSDRIRELTAREIPRLYWIGATLQSAALQAEIDWVEQTIADLASGSLPWEHVTKSTPASPSN